MKILFTICGRAGSKGIPNKNIKDFLGYPLPFYTVSAIDMYSKAHPAVYCDIALNTDSPELIKLIKSRFNIKIEIIKRIPSLGLDNTPKISVILNTYIEVMKRNSVAYDMIVDLDITSPLRTLTDIEKLIEKKAQTNADIVFSVTDSRRNPYFNMVKRGDCGYERVIKSTFNSRQEAPVIYDMNASLYAYSPAFLMSKKGIFDGKCEIIHMMDTAVLDLDHEMDLELMTVIAEHLFEKHPEYRKIRDNIEEILCKR